MYTVYILTNTDKKLFIGVIKVPEFDINEIRAKLGLDQITNVVNTISADLEAKKALEDAKNREAAENARVQKLIDAQLGEDKAKFVEAQKTIQKLETELKSNAETFANALEKMQNEVIGYSDQIKQILSARDNSHTFISTSISKALFNDADSFEKEVENVALVSMITEKGMFETKYGEAHLKAVNGSSSIEVSSESYETIFSNRILRDIQKMLVVGNLFEELPMTSKLLTMMIEPESGVDRKSVV